MAKINKNVVNPSITRPPRMVSFKSPKPIRKRSPNIAVVIINAMPTMGYLIHLLILKSQSI